MSARRNQGSIYRNSKKNPRPCRRGFVFSARFFHLECRGVLEKFQPVDQYRFLAAIRVQSDGTRESARDRGALREIEKSVAHVVRDFLKRAMNDQARRSIGSLRFIDPLAHVRNLTTVVLEHYRIQSVSYKHGSTRFSISPKRTYRQVQLQLSKLHCLYGLILISVRADFGNGIYFRKTQ